MQLSWKRLDKQMSYEKFITCHQNRTVSWQRYEIVYSDRTLCPAVAYRHRWPWVIFEGHSRNSYLNFNNFSIANERIRGSCACLNWQTDKFRKASGLDNKTFRKLGLRSVARMRPELPPFGKFWHVFTARCTLVQSAVLRSHVVCLSVCLSVCLWRWWIVIT